MTQLSYTCNGPLPLVFLHYCYKSTQSSRWVITSSTFLPPILYLSLKSSLSLAYFSHSLFVTLSLLACATSHPYQVWEVRENSLRCVWIMIFHPSVILRLNSIKSREYYRLHRFLSIVDRVVNSRIGLWWCIISIFLVFFYFFVLRVLFSFLALVPFVQ